MKKQERHRSASVMRVKKNTGRIREQQKWKKMDERKAKASARGHSLYIRHPQPSTTSSSFFAFTLL